ncbi:hypothetical protein DL96DRAFT_1604249, partial [Flagelloscypha sp. PMI_526]
MAPVNASYTSAPMASTLSSPSSGPQIQVHNVVFIVILFFGWLGVYLYRIHRRTVRERRQTHEVDIVLNDSEKGGIWSSAFLDDELHKQYECPEAQSHSVFGALKKHFSQGEAPTRDEKPQEDETLDPSPSADLSIRCQGISKVEEEEYFELSRDDSTLELPTFDEFVECLAQRSVEDAQAVEDVELEFSSPTCRSSSDAAGQVDEEPFEEEDDSFSCVDALPTSFSSTASSPRNAPPRSVLAPMLQRWIAAECGGSWGHPRFPSSERRRKWCPPGQSPLRKTYTAKVVTPLRPSRALTTASIALRPPHNMSVKQGPRVVKAAAPKRRRGKENM